MNLYKIEVCVETYEEVLKAHSKGADQIELCAQLELDGLTPPIDLIKKVLDDFDIYTKVMIRPRGGNFTYSPSELSVILEQTRQIKALDIEEIVFGALLNNRLDIGMIKEVAAIAHPMKLTIHKAIDESINPIKDIEELKLIENVVAILSSGQMPTAQEGISNLIAMKKACGDKIKLIAAGKIVPSNLELIHTELQLAYYHGRQIL